MTVSYVSLKLSEAFRHAAAVAGITCDTDFSIFANQSLIFHPLHSPVKKHSPTAKPQEEGFISSAKAATVNLTMSADGQMARPKNASASTIVPD